MIKLSAICAAALFALSGAASATTLLTSNAAPYSFKTDKDNAAVLALPSAQADGIFVDFTFSFTKTLQDNDFMAVWFGDKNGPNVGLKANCGDGTCTNDLFVRMSGTGGTYISGSDLVAGTEYHLYAYLSKSGTSTTYNTLQAWLNPTADQIANLTGASVSITGNTGKTAYDTVGIRTAFLADNSQVVNVSNLDVSAVPEPATLSLFGLAAAGMGFLRRRKQA